MKSFPSPGDGLARTLRNLIDELKRLKLRVATLARKVQELEDRISTLEDEP